MCFCYWSRTVSHVTRLVVTGSFQGEKEQQLIVLDKLRAR